MWTLAGFLACVFFGLVFYASVLTSKFVAPIAASGVLKALDQPVESLLHAVASRFEGELSQQRGYIRAAEDPTVHFRHCFRRQDADDKHRVFYARCGFASALLGGNVLAEAREQLAKYLGLALGKNGFAGRGYKVSWVPWASCSKIPD